LDACLEIIFIAIIVHILVTRVFDRRFDETFLFFFFARLLHKKTPSHHRTNARWMRALKL
jgi:hypothetical protein